MTLSRNDLFVGEIYMWSNLFVTQRLLCKSKNMFFLKKNITYMSSLEKFVLVERYKHSTLTEKKFKVLKYKILFNGFVYYVYFNDKDTFKNVKQL